MTLSNKNIFVRWYKATKRKYPNDFCALFWHSFWWTFGIGVNVWNIIRLSWVTMLIAVLVSIGIILLVIAIFWIKERFFSSEATPAKPKTRLRENAETWWGAIRGKYCTKVYILEK